jgi:hypothetical protein
MSNQHEQSEDTGLVPYLEEQASREIRKVWHEERWFFSVNDVIGLLTEAPKPRMYWADMKRRIQDEGFVEVLAKCQQLKMRAPDGKERLTDAADTETMLRLIQSIPSPKAEPFKQWLARVGVERLAEIEAPERAADRMRQLYRQRGYSEEWIRAASKHRRPRGVDWGVARTRSDGGSRFRYPHGDSSHRNV